MHLDIAQLQRKGLSGAAVMRVSWPSGASIGITHLPTWLRLLYRWRPGENEEWQTVRERVPLVTTQQRLGGRRQWFGCPGCGRRCRVLYGAILHGGGRFRCRRCHHLRYSSQAETKADRATRAMFKIVKRLAPEQDYNDLPAKPKRMHWRTYNRLAKRYEGLGAQWAREAMRRFGIKL